jgi:hypothetical protein
MKLTRTTLGLTIFVVAGSAFCISGKSYADDPAVTINILEQSGIITHEQAEKARSLAAQTPAAPAAGTVQAPASEDQDKRIGDLQQQIDILKRQREVDLENKAATAVPPSKVVVDSWVTQMKWYGDLRLRFEDFDNPGDWSKSPDAPVYAKQPDRIRYRIRLRLGVDTKLQDWADLGVRLTTGDNFSGSTYIGTSGNTTMGNTFRKKGIALDLAYVTVHPPLWDWIKVTGGVLPNPVWRPLTLSPTFYKADVNPQGLAEQLSFKFGDYDQYRLFGNFGQYVLTEQVGTLQYLNGTYAGEGGDAYLFDSEVGIEAKLDPVPVKVTGGVAFFDTSNLGKVTPGDSSNQGNSLNVNASSPFDGAYLGDFHDAEGLGEAAWTISPHPFLGTPNVLTLGGEFIKNFSTVYDRAPGGNYTEAWGLQATYGQAKTKGQWQVGYEYKRVEANSVLDSIVDDDFSVGYGGFGKLPGSGTDIEGHVVGATYNIFDWWAITSKADICDRISPVNVIARPPLRSHPSSPSGEYAVRIQVDSTFKF